MKTRYRFTLEASRIELPNRVEATFVTAGNVAVELDGKIVPEHIENYEIEIAIEPETREPKAGEWALLYITLAGTPEKYWPFAERLAEQVVDHLSFYYDTIRLLRGMVFAERIPETAGEREAVGDKTFAARANFVQAEPPQRFDRRHLETFPHSKGLDRVMRQYAAARRARNPIDSYLNMFKVVESLYHRGRSRAREALAASDEFREHLTAAFTVTRDGQPQVPTDADVVDMISTLVSVRDNCAHLREHNAFGFAPGDAEVFTSVQPLFDILSVAATAAIEARIAVNKRGVVSGA